ncbi:MAG: hypothetical protein UV70_C0010G0050 [Parcubacteria group bacterium GW2011_GWA2_43_13]|nr:MAG: hypothetical protein UV70_C0010G0050 [Parcubacteria group bacterium GW2011_GWA2_43_13]
MRKGEKLKFKERRNVFLRDPFSLELRNHVLRGQYDGCRSIDITGDLRVIYREEGGGIVSFLAIGTHSELYG